MSTPTLLYLFARFAHILLAAVWVGAIAFIAFFLLPALKDTGGGGGPVMAALLRRRLTVFNAIVGGLTVVTGMWLYWRFTGGFDPALAGSMPARVFGTGAIAGILALMLDSALLGKNLKKMSGTGAPMDATAARERAARYAKVVLVLQAIALATMAVAHYV